MLQKFTVFNVDDDRDDQDILLMVIKEIDASIECIFAKHSVYALEKLKDISFLPDLIFLDINMPRMNGLQCLEEIKKIKRLKHIPVYIYSTCADYDLVKECINLGAIGFIKKQTSIEEAKKEFKLIIDCMKLNFH